MRMVALTPMKKGCTHACVLTWDGHKAGQCSQLSHGQGQHLGAQPAQSVHTAVHSSLFLFACFTNTVSYFLLTSKLTGFFPQFYYSIFNHSSEEESKSSKIFLSALLRLKQCGIHLSKCGCLPSRLAVPDTEWTKQKEWNQRNHSTHQLRLLPSASTPYSPTIPPKAPSLPNTHPQV